jgi:dipeptidyl aminopeptidase/acylaminoacyl peptidase
MNSARALRLTHKLSNYILPGTLMISGAIFCPTAPAQNPVPRATFEGECTAMAFAPDGRLAYSIRHVFDIRTLQVQRDDIWVLESDGRRRKIVNGERLVQGPAAFSYTITRLRWSPDGTRLTAELHTSQLVRGAGKQDSNLLLLINQDGKEIKIIAGESVIRGALDGTWLGDNNTVAYLAQSAKSDIMYSVGVAHIDRGRGGVLFEDRAFAAVAWNAKLGTAAAIDRGPGMFGQPTLVVLDLLKEEHRPLIVLDAYIGGLSISPSGSKFAYFTDTNTLEVRDIAHPEQPIRVPAEYGTVAWAPDESRLLLKTGIEREEGNLMWVSLSGPPKSTELTSADHAPGSNLMASTPALFAGQSFRDFALSPDGHSLAVILFDKRTLQVYDLK